MKNNGLIHIYTGDGKGKTTAAVGLAVRARGAGKRVLFIQFLKARLTCEQQPMQHLGIEVMRLTSCEHFFFEMDDGEKEQCILEQQEAFLQAKMVMLHAGYDLLILDEILDAVSLGCISQGELIDALQYKAPDLEVILTGRDACSQLYEMADYLSVISGVKHPFDKNMPARLGIEY